MMDLQQLLEYLRGPGRANTAGLAAVAQAMNDYNLPYLGRSPSISAPFGQMGAGKYGSPFSGAYGLNPGVPVGSPYSGQTGVIPQGPAMNPGAGPPVPAGGQPPVGPPQAPMRPPMGMNPTSALMAPAVGLASQPDVYPSIQALAQQHQNQGGGFTQWLSNLFHRDPQAAAQTSMTAPPNQPMPLFPPNAPGNGLGTVGAAAGMPMTPPPASGMMNPWPGTQMPGTPMPMSRPNPGQDLGIPMPRPRPPMHLTAPPAYHSGGLANNLNNSGPDLLSRTAGPSVIDSMLRRMYSNGYYDHNAVNTASGMAGVPY